MKSLTPRRIVAELDKYIVGQDDAKRSVAIALRNRWRRQQLPPELQDEVAPKNIIMIGPTGVGKTEIARRLAALVDAPFLKVEASKYTEVGYHGRDVESMIRDLTGVAVAMVSAEFRKNVQSKAEAAAEEQLLDALLPIRYDDDNSPVKVRPETREKIRSKLRAGKLEDRELEISVEDKPAVEIVSNASIEQVGVDLQSAFERMLPTREITRKLRIREARRVLEDQEAERMIDRDEVHREAVERTENTGIIVLDEIDKIAGPTGGKGHGPDVSREGVQRDLLPIVEGSSVPTRYGRVRTDHILFIAAGAFHMSKPSDLIPELQGRFPIRVELSELGRDDFVRILTEPENALIKQYKALMQAEDVAVEFDTGAIGEIARIAAVVNERMQDIGARRLQTVMEKLLEEISFNAPDMSGQTVRLDAAMVTEKLKDIAEDEDLSRYIL